MCYIEKKKKRDLYLSIQSKAQKIFIFILKGVKKEKEKSSVLQSCRQPTLHMNFATFFCRSVEDVHINKQYQRIQCVLSL